MGPQLFSYGYVVVQSVVVMGGIASMGPQLFSYGYLITEIENALYSYGFNGATTFQLWIFRTR